MPLVTTGMPVASTKRRAASSASSAQTSLPRTSTGWRDVRSSAVIRLNATATANAPLLANSGSTTAGAIYVLADGGVAATRWLRLGARAVAGAVPQGVLVKFAGNEAARWGLPFLAVFVLVDLSW